MWANFGPAIQVKHLTLDKKLAQSIIDQVETDHIVIVCRDTDADIIKTIAGQISWGQRVRGIICESDLARWYKLCMQGNFSSLLATNLLDRLQAGFAAEFPQSLALQDFLAERDYLSTTVDDFWITDTDVQKSQDKDS
jgi:type II restriction enzyme